MWLLIVPKIWCILRSFEIIPNFAVINVQVSLTLVLLQIDRQSLLLLGILPVFSSQSTNHIKTMAKHLGSTIYCLSGPNSWYLVSCVSKLSSWSSITPTYSCHGALLASYLVGMCDIHLLTLAFLCLRSNIRILSIHIFPGYLQIIQQWLKLPYWSFCVCSSAF